MIQFSIFALLTLADFWLTRRRIKLFGEGVEVNPFKAFMSRFKGGLFISFLPELALAAFLAHAGVLCLMWGWIGGKLVVCYYQVLSMDFEKQLKIATSETPSLPSSEVA